MIEVGPILFDQRRINLFLWRRRLHHGQAGAIMLLVGLVRNSLPVVLVGIAVMLHDIDDVSEWFHFRRLGA